MKSLITVDDKKHFEDFLPLFSTIISSKDSDHHFTNLKSREVHPDCFKFLKAEPCVKNGTGFCLAISLHDGTVLFVSSTVNKLLGYTKDMLLGRCFLNYLYPQDRITLANQLTHGLQAQFSETVPPQQHSENTFFCRIRQYHSLKCGFGVSDKKTRYKAFQFITRVKNLAQDDDSCAEEGGHTICLIATATPVASAYKASEEIPTMSSFSTRHTADCHFSHVDSSSIPYLGYLPQDILGFSIFDFYHMDDMPQLKDIYELVMKEQGNSFRSKPYRFKVSNGNYIFLETEWSCFINPWSKKLEFVVGQHRVLKGPININVFGENLKEESVISDEILRESQRIQEEIKCLLSQPVKGFGEGGRHRCPKRKVGIASFVSSLVEEMCHGRVGNAAVGQEAKEECSCSDHGSVVMGEISPHQEYNGSDPSSMTPETSQEIRYQDNIERFFASQPKTYSSSDGSGESKSENCQQMCSMSSSYEESGKNSLVDSGNGSLRTKSESLQQVDMSQASSSRGSGGGSTENFISRNSLTEENLTQHNRLTQKYKQQQQRKVKLSASSNMQPRKEMRMKRVGSPQQLESNKHNKTSKIRGNNTVPAQTESECPPTNSGGCKSEVNRSGQHSGSGAQSAGHIPMGPFSLNPSFPSFIPPIMSQASSMPWSNMVTSSYTTPPYNSSIPSFGMPQQYCYMPGGSPASSAPPTPFFMPVMYFGAMPIYPPMSPVVPHSSTGIWPSFMPGQQPTPSMPGQQPTPSMPGQPQPHPQECSVSQDVATSTQEHNSQGGSSRYSGSVPVYSLSTMTESNSEKKVKMSVTSGRQWVNKDTSGASGLAGPRANSCSKSKDVITSFSGTFCKQSTPPYMVGNTAEQHKQDSTVQSDNNQKCSVVGSAEATVILEQPQQDAGNNNKRTSSIMRMDEDSGYPHHARPTAIHECERDSVSMASSSSLIKSDDLSSHSPSDRTEQELELEFKEVLKHPRRVPKDPPWMEGLEMTPDLIFRYQLTSESLEEVLKKDMEALKGLTQPDLVNKQLAMLQSELAAEADCDTGGQEDSQKEGDGLRQAGSSSSKTISLQQKKEVDLGFATVEDDVGEELQAKEDAILHFMCENM